MLPNQGSTAGSSGIYGGTGQTNLNANYVEGVLYPTSTHRASGTGRRHCGVGRCGQPVLRADQRARPHRSAAPESPTTPSIPAETSSTAPSFDFVRNTMFDTWGYVKQPNGATGIEVKRASTRTPTAARSAAHYQGQALLFGSYEGYHYTKISNTAQGHHHPHHAKSRGQLHR